MWTWVGGRSLPFGSSRLAHAGARKTNWQGAYNLQAVRQEDKIQPETHCASGYLRSCLWKRSNWELLETETEAEDEEEGSIFKGREPYIPKHGSERGLWSFKRTSGESAQNYRQIARLKLYIKTQCLKSQLINLTCTMPLEELIC